MNEILLVFASAFWFGILTSISPCPLATNIAAVSFIAKNVSRRKTVLSSGISYTIGRMVTYAIVGFIIIKSLLSVPAVAIFLQQYINRALGPILIIIGLFLLGLFKFSLPAFSISPLTQTRLAEGGARGSFLLGVLFALAFCPLSAALFFGSLIPLALAYKFGAILPLVYGAGTGLPVLVFAVLIALSIEVTDKWFRKVAKIEIYARTITGIIFILTGAYYVFFYIVPGIFK